MLKIHSIKVTVVNVETEDVLSYYLNPNVHIRDVKRELRRKGILTKGMCIFYNDIELQDKQQVKEIGIKDGSGLELRSKE